METIIVIGSGTMATGIAAGFLAAGMKTVLLGRDAERANEALEAARSLAADMLSPGGTVAPAVSGLLKEWDDWRDVVWVIETVAEELTLKQEIFASLDIRVPPHIPIGTNSSGYPISRIARDLPTRHRMFNAHYFMPAHLVPLVEIALGEDSDPQIGEQICHLYRRVGKKPVLIRRDIPGLLANRIQHALMREALSLIDSGIASPEDVDAAVRYSFGFRYAAAGPILQKDISGWESMARATEEIYPSLSNTTSLAACIDKLLAEGRTGMKAGAGFQPWPPEKAAKERKAYERRLKASFDVLNLE